MSGHAVSGEREQGVRVNNVANSKLSLATRSRFKYWCPNLQRKHFIEKLGLAIGFIFKYGLRVFKNAIIV